MATSFKADSVFVSGLDPSIGEHELRTEIFPDYGVILAVSISYDRNGKSLGQATIRFQVAANATKAQKDLDGALVDGKRMTVQLIGVPVAPRVIVKATPVTPPAPVPQPKKTPTPTPQPKKSAPLPPQQQRRAPIQQAPIRRAPIPRSTIARGGAARPIMAPRQTRSQAPLPPIRRTPVTPPRRSAPPSRPVPKKVGGKAPVTKKGPVKGKKAAAPKKSVSAADLDAQLDKYNAGREAKSE